MSALDPFVAAKAEAMMYGYDARWAGEMAGYEVLAVEAEFRAPLINPETSAASRSFIRGGKLDVFVRAIISGRKVLFEHKTSTEDISPGSPYRRRLLMDGQVSNYFTGAKALGWGDVDECMYDVLAKPEQRPLKATPEENRKYTADGRLYAKQRDRDETPEEYFSRVAEAIAEDPNAYYARFPVVRLAAEVEEACWDDWQIAAQIRENTRAKRHPRNPDACLRFGRPCEFFDVCTGTARLDDRTRFIQSDDVHPELSVRKEGLPLLTASRMKAARACARLHQLRYIDGYRPAVEPEALYFGSLIHRALEAWWGWYVAAPATLRADAPLSALQAAIGAIYANPQSHAA